MANAIELTPDIQNLIQQAAMQYGVDPNVMSAIAAVLSGGSQNFVSQTGAVGVMAVLPQIGLDLGFDVYDLNDNINAGAAYLQQLLTLFSGNTQWALGGYYSGSNAVLFYDGIPPFSAVQNFVYNVTQLAMRAGSNLTTKATFQNASHLDANGSLAANKTTAGQYVPPQGTVVDTNQSAGFQQSLYTPLQINDGLNVTPWYKDSTLLTGNPRARKNVQPVSFQIFLSQQVSYDGKTQQLTNPTTGQPIILELNTSLAQFELSSRHVYTRTPSRTGMHITFWGMEPDLMTGSGTTGVFMNRFGITDFFSVANVTDDIKQLVTSGFTHTQGGTNTRTNTATGTSSSSTITTHVSNPDNFDTIVAKQSTGKAGLQPGNPSEAFRVAAQDAFVEFLSMFKMNGNVWFHNPNSKQNLTGQDQSTPTGWSPQTGASTFQQNARNNDVFSRGGVAMRFRNTTYLGYFKSLSWTMDAENPFQWKFNFVFQVERTYTSLYIAKTGGGM
jgi:hypothetical protein